MSLVSKLAATLPDSQEIRVQIDMGDGEGPQPYAIGLRRLAPGALIEIGTPRVAFDPAALAGALGQGQPEPDPRKLLAGLDPAALQATLAQRGHTDAAIACAAVASIRPADAPAADAEPLALVLDRAREAPAAGRLWAGRFPSAVLAEIAAAVRTEEADRGRAVAAFRR